MTARVLVVTGMHRSGTSLVANYLHRAGIAMGDELIPADVGNPLGYYEDVDFHDLQRELLWKAGVTDAFTVTSSDLPIPVDDAFRGRAHEIAAKRASRAQWGWKDPRTALFLDLWEQVLPGASFLFVFRRPLVVLDSLLRRAGNESVNQSPELALVMWRVFNEQMLGFTERHPERCLWLETEAFVTDSSSLLSSLRSHFGFDLSSVPVGDVFVDDAYHRNVRMRARSFARRHRAETHACEALYERLCSISGAPR